MSSGYERYINKVIIIIIIIIPLFIVLSPTMLSHKETTFGLRFYLCNVLFKSYNMEINHGRNLLA